MNNQWGATQLDQGNQGATLIVLSLFSALAAFFYYQYLGFQATGGIFEYPLDDTYIHLSMSEQIARGNYGINQGEYSAASSSILFPFLLAPFAGFEFHRLLPLIYNILAVAGSAILWGMVVRRAGLMGWVGVGLALFGPLVLNIPGVAFYAMENALHTTFALVTLVGLIRFLDRPDRGSKLLMVGILVSPLIRYESAGLSLLCCLAIFVLGARKTAIALAGLVVLAQLAFAGFLISLGLEPLPNSVLIKLYEGVESTGGLVADIIARFAENTRYVTGLVLLLLTMIAAFLGAVPGLGVPVKYRRLSMIVAAMGFGHLLIGRVHSQYDRYENYALVFIFGALIIVAAHMRQRAFGAIFGVLLCVIVVLQLPYKADLLFNFTLRSPGAIHAQHRQMTRFAQDFLEAPVAVNDIGMVAYRNDNYTLDLWGLGSLATLKIRFSEPAPGWAGDLVAAHNIRAVMIYENWIKDGIDPDWIKIGVLRARHIAGIIGGLEVTFFAPKQEDVSFIVEKLPGFIATLPETAEFEYAPGIQSPEDEVSQ